MQQICNISWRGLFVWGHLYSWRSGGCFRPVGISWWLLVTKALLLTTNYYFYSLGVRCGYCCRGSNFYYFSGVIGWLVTGGKKTTPRRGVVFFLFTIIFYHIFAEFVKSNLLRQRKIFSRCYNCNRFVTSRGGASVFGEKRGCTTNY